MYKSAIIDKTKCPDVVKNSGNHVAMCDLKDGKLYWNYERIKNAIG